jgi:hypothetical protein
LSRAVAFPFGYLEANLPRQIRLGNRFRPPRGSGGFGDGHALFRRQLFHPNLPAGFPAFAADLSQIFGYRSSSSHFADSKAASLKLQLPPTPRAT